MAAPSCVMEQASGLLDRLERHRDFTFHRLKSRRVTGERTALGFIDKCGFLTAFTAGLGVPCLREAIAGEREPAIPEHIQHDYAIGKTWELKDILPAKRLAYYGKAIAGRPSFIARDLLPAFLRLRAAPGGHKALYAHGSLSRCAMLVIDALVRRGPAETRALKLSAGYARP
ncbi:MAG: AlkZ-related protein, partial [Candidatus Binataceae bacterium]